VTIFKDREIRTISIPKQRTTFGIIEEPHSMIFSMKYLSTSSIISCRDNKSIDVGRFAFTRGKSVIVVESSDPFILSLASQETREENSRDDPREALQTNEERRPTGKSTAFERIYDFIALRKRIPCFDRMNAPNNRGLALETAIASSIASNPKTSYQRSGGREEIDISVDGLAQGVVVD
jgi:hypothetical protein